MVADIQGDLVANFMRGDLARLRATHTGEFVSKILFDAGLVRDAVTTGALNYVYHGLTLAAMLAVMLAMDWPLAAVVLIAAPIVGWVLRDYSKRTVKATRGAMHESSALTTAVMESLDGVRVVKMENKEAYEEARVGQAIARRQAHLIANADAHAMAAPVSEIMSTLLVAVVVCYGGWRFQLGVTHLGPLVVPALTPGAFVAFLGALMYGGQSLRQVAFLQTMMSEGRAAATRLFGTLDVTPRGPRQRQRGPAADGRGDGSAGERLLHLWRRRAGAGWPHAGGAARRDRRPGRPIRRRQDHGAGPYPALLRRQRRTADHRRARRARA